MPANASSALGKAREPKRSQVLLSSGGRFHRVFLWLGDTVATVTHIYERLFLRCPYVRARDYLQEALQTAGNGMLVRYERGNDPLHFDEPWIVFWGPAGAGPYPDFVGELTVRADENYRSAVLELSGEYAPPFGGLGGAFDVVIGTKIGSSTARTLLRKIGNAIEDLYRASTMPA